MAGVFYDKGYSRVLLVTGSLLVVFGLMMVSLCHQYYQIFLAQGICVGIGTSLLWIPAMTVVAARFQTSIRAVAIGIVSSGSSIGMLLRADSCTANLTREFIGGVVYPIMFRRLQPHVGFPWAVRIMAFVALGVFILALSFLLPPRPYKSPNARQLMDRTSFKDVPFLVFIFCGLPTLIGYFTPLVYLPTFVEASIPTNNRADIAFYILSVTNGASSFSRIGGGLVAAKFGPCGTYAFALASSSVLLFGWIGIKSLGGLIIWAILWGLTTGLIISMPGAIVPLLCPNHAVLGTRMGMTFLGAAVGILIGSPIGGKLIAEGSSAEPIWWPLQIFTALTMAMGALLMCYPWLCVSRKQRALKVNEDT